MPEPMSEPLFGRVIAMLDDFTAACPTMSLEELRILETTVKREISARRATVAADLRAKGYTWTEVGRALAISGQRAHAAYSAAEKPAEIDLDRPLPASAADAERPTDHQEGGPPGPVGPS